MLLCERPAKGLWAGMMQPPTVESDVPLGVDALAGNWGVAVERVGAFTHVTSHRTVEFAVHAVRGAAEPGIAGARRVALAELGSLALSNAAWRTFECAGVPVRTPPSASAGRRAPRAARSSRSGS